VRRRVSEPEACEGSEPAGVPHVRPQRIPPTDEGPESLRGLGGLLEEVAQVFPVRRPGEGELDVPDVGRDVLEGLPCLLGGRPAGLVHVVENGDLATTKQACEGLEALPFPRRR